MEEQVKFTEVLKAHKEFKSLVKARRWESKFYMSGPYGDVTLMFGPRGSDLKIMGHVVIAYGNSDTNKTMLDAYERAIYTIERYDEPKG